MIPAFLLLGITLVFSHADSDGIRFVTSLDIPVADQPSPGEYLIKIHFQRDEFEKTLYRLRRVTVDGDTSLQTHLDGRLLWSDISPVILDWFMSDDPAIAAEIIWSPPRCEPVKRVDVAVRKSDFIFKDIDIGCLWGDLELTYLEMEDGLVKFKTRIRNPLSVTVDARIEVNEMKIGKDIIQYSWEYEGPMEPGFNHITLPCITRENMRESLFLDRIIPLYSQTISLKGTMMFKWGNRPIVVPFSIEKTLQKSRQENKPYDYKPPFQR